MRNFTTIIWVTVLWLVTFAMVWAIYGVLSQPMMADEKKEILKPGYIPQAAERSQIDSKRFSRSEGYLYDPSTGTSRHVELRGYTYGNQTYYTGRVGRTRIELKPDARIPRKEE